MPRLVTPRGWVLQRVLEELGSFPPMDIELRPNTVSENLSFHLACKLQVSSLGLGLEPGPPGRQRVRAPQSLFPRASRWRRGGRRERDGGRQEAHGASGRHLSAPAAAGSPHC